MPLFGSKKKAAPPPKESISKLRETLEMLEKREEYLQKKCEQELQNAKKFMAQKNKRSAAMCLKRKKTYESQMEKLGGARMTIEQQVMTLEGANVSLQAMNAMKQGAASMKQIHGQMNIDQVDDTMDDIREQMDIANEINEAISQPLGDMYDEDELLNELEELEQEGIEEQFLNSQATPATSLPSAPSTNPIASQPTKAPQKSEEEELRLLEASMM